MSKHTLSGWEEEDKDVSVILIATHLDDFRLAYSLNKHCSTLFVNVSDVLNIQKFGENHSFTKYVSNYKSTTNRCYLVHNQIITKSSPATSKGLFANSESIKLPLLKSYSKWPFLLISSSESSQELMNGIRLTPNISAFQAVDFQSLSKYNQNIIYNIYNED